MLNKVYELTLKALTETFDERQGKDMFQDCFAYKSTELEVIIESFMADSIRLNWEL